MMKFAQESGKSKGQFYTPSEVSRTIARLIGIGNIKQKRESAGLCTIRQLEAAPSLFVQLTKLLPMREEIQS